MTFFYITALTFNFISLFLLFLGGQAQGAEGMHMQAYTFPRTSGARNPIVIFIFLRLKVVLQAKLCKWV